MKAAHILSFAFSCLLFAGCTKSNDHPNEERVKVGDPLPYFSVAGADGAIYRSFDLNGKTTLICFFNTTCPDCHRELPKLQYV